MEGFTGSPEQFQQAYLDVDDIAGQMMSNMSTLRDRIEATRAGWQGEAAQAFQNVMDTFDERNQKLNDTLAGIAELLQKSGNTYAEAEEEQNVELNNIASTLEGV